MSGRHSPWREPTRRTRRTPIGRMSTEEQLTDAERNHRDVALDTLLGVHEWPNRHVGGGA